MNGLAALLALALVQSPEAQPAPAPAAPPEASPPPTGQPPPAAQRPAPQFVPSPPAPAAAPSPEPAPPAPEPETRPPAAEPVPSGTPRPRRSPAAPAPASTAKPPPGAASAAPDAGPAPPPSAPAPSVAPKPAVAAEPLPAPPSKEAKPSPERVQVAAAASRFFQALLARRPGDLAALCAPTFSFDGQIVSGAEAVRSRWVEIVASRDGAAYALLDLEVLSADDAQARQGKPPKRIAPLAATGTWVALANLSGRPTFVFFARQAGAWIATGMHD